MVSLLPVIERRRISAAMKTLILSATLLISSAFLPGCATNTGDEAADRRGRITNAIAQGVFTQIANFAAAKADSSSNQDAAMAAFISAKGVSSLAQTVRDIKVAAGPQVAAVVREQAINALPPNPTPQESSFIKDVVGSALLHASQLAVKKFL